jgi:multidrug resistance efflux pump
VSHGSCHNGRAMAGGVPEPEDFKTFIREITRRHELATEAMIRRSDEQSAAMRDHFDAQNAETRAHTEAVRGLIETLHGVTDNLREFAEEMRAQRAALFAILDRLDGGSAGANA